MTEAIISQLGQPHTTQIWDIVVGGLLLLAILAAIGGAEWLVARSIRSAWKWFIASVKRNTPPSP